MTVYGSSESFADPGWYPDSSASSHVTADYGNLMHRAEYNGQEQVHVGNGKGLCVKHIGYSCIKSPFDPNIPLSLNNLLHVPEIIKNFVSVSKFAKDNKVFFEFHPTYCSVKLQGTNKVILQGKVDKDGLYQFDNFQLKHLANSSTDSVAFNSTSSGNSVSHSFSLSHNFSTVPSLQLWHCRLGHPSLQVVQKTLKMCKIPFSNKEPYDFCSACACGKSQKLPSPSYPNVYTNPLELLYSDLWGPAPIPSNNGNLYYLSIIDAFSRYTWIYPIKRKSDTLETFIHFQTLVENQVGTTIKAIQTDWGGEFRPFQNFLKTHGIAHRVTCPHAHQQNGTVERKHKHIVQMALTLLSHAHLPLKFWEEAFITSVYLINRLPSLSRPDSDSPLFTIFKRNPDYSFLKVFRCACYPLLTPFNRHKF